MVEALIEYVAPYGPVALMCLYFVWREEKRDKSDSARETRRDELAQQRVVADTALAVAMTLLAERINR